MFVYVFLLGFTEASYATTQLAGPQFNSSIGTSQANRKFQVESIRSLIDEAKRAEAVLTRLGPDVSNLEERIAQVQREMAGVLEEMRQGYFCSGCGQTRSAIEAKGETFPHAGQSIVKATPEQLKEAERGFEKRIADMRKTLTEFDSAKQKRFLKAQEADAHRHYWYDAAAAEDSWRARILSDYVKTATDQLGILRRQIDQVRASILKAQPESDSHKILTRTLEKLKSSEKAKVDSIFGQIDRTKSQMEQQRRQHLGERDQMKSLFQELSDNYFMPGSGYSSLWSNPISYGPLPSRPQL